LLRIFGTIEECPGFVKRSPLEYSKVKHAMVSGQILLGVAVGRPDEEGLFSGPAWIVLAENVMDSFAPGEFAEKLKPEKRMDKRSCQNLFYR
jgi:hypothetical protein